jgi:Na+/H+ antiporter NhaA
LALLFGIALYVFLNRRKIDQMQLKLVVSILLFCMILATAIGFFACVSGAIVRYRIPVFIALFWVLSIYINPPEKWKK